MIKTKQPLQAINNRDQTSDNKTSGLVWFSAEKI